MRYYLLKNLYADDTLLFVDPNIPDRLFYATLKSEMAAAKSSVSSLFGASHCSVHRRWTDKCIDVWCGSVGERAAEQSGSVLPHRGESSSCGLHTIKDTSTGRWELPLCLHSDQWRERGASVVDHSIHRAHQHYGTRCRTPSGRGSNQANTQLSA